MIRLNLKRLQSSLVSALAVVACLSHAEVANSSSDEKSHASRITDADIVWDSLGFHGGPRIVGENATAVFRGNVNQTPDLMKKLNDDTSFIAAHVLLTELWRVSQNQKNTFSHALNDGFFVCYNGLNVRIKWVKVQGEEEKSVEIADLSCQKKRLREFWTKRLHDHPEEFSDYTQVGDR